MCWASILLRHAESGKNMTYISSKIALLKRSGLITDSDKIQIYALLLQKGKYQEADLDSFVTNVWITIEERQMIIDAPTVEC